MKLTRPAYYSKFHCIGSQCRDNCCVGWEIDLDEDTNRYYHSLPGPFGDRLRSSISSPHEGHFLLQEERCPFLNQDNLCDIILTLGEDHLCQICADHPRFYEWFGARKEAGISLCCEAAGQLILQSAEPVCFETLDIPEKAEPFSGDEELLQTLFSVREGIFSLLQNRAFSISERLALLLFLTDQLQEWVDRGQVPLLQKAADQFQRTGQLQKLLADMGKIHCETEEQNTIFSQILQVYCGLEPMNPGWSRTLKEMQPSLPSLLRKRWEFLGQFAREYEYEQMAVYWIYRYFMKSCFDQDLISKANFAAVSFLLVSLLGADCWARTGELTLQDQIIIAKDYSKEIEYSLDNLEVLADAAWEHPSFQTAALTKILLCP